MLDDVVIVIHRALDVGSTHELVGADRFALPAQNRRGSDEEGDDQLRSQPADVRDDRSYDDGMM
jgi:hypothetical protein